MTDAPRCPAMPPILQALVIATLATLLLPTSGESGVRSRDEDQMTEKLCDRDARQSMPSAFLRDDGSAWDPKTSTSYPNGTYWSAEENNSSVIYGCPCAMGQPCLRKCCEIDMVMDSKMRCVKRSSGTNDDGGAWFRSVIFELISKDVVSVNGTDVDFGLLTGKHCEKRIKPFKNSKPRIRATDFSLCLTKYSGEDCIDFTNFCVDYNKDTNSSEPILCSLNLLFDKEEEHISNILKLVTQTLSSIALVFIILLYSLVPDLRNTHGKCHMCHSFALLTYYIVENILVGWPHLRLVKDACAFFGPAEIFFYLAPLSWLNMMSLDILFAFISLQPVPHFGGHGGLTKLILYSAYAWGLPALYLTTTILIDFTKKQKLDIATWCAKGLFKDWLYRKYAMYALLTVNGIIFAMTAFKIFTLKRKTSKSMGHDSQRHSKDADNSAARTKIYLKLSLLMGFHWILEPITKLLHNMLRRDERLAVRVIWRAISLVNRLQGIFILIMFLRNKKLSRAVWKKLNKSKLWTNFTGKIVEMSSSSKQTTSNIELRDATAPPASALASSRGSVISFLESDGPDTSPSGMAQTPSPTALKEETSGTSNAAESQRKKSIVGFSNAGFSEEMSVPGENSSQPIGSSSKVKDSDANVLGIMKEHSSNETGTSTMNISNALCKEQEDICVVQCEKDKDKYFPNPQKETPHIPEQDADGDGDCSSKDTEFLFS